MKAPVLVIAVLGLIGFAFAALDGNSVPIVATPDQSAISAGASTGVTVQMSQAATSDTTVTLSSSNPSVLATPGSVIVRQGNQSARFSVISSPVAGKEPSPGTAVTITATANGGSASTVITVN
jgi:hypothetical protein